MSLFGTGALFLLPIDPHITMRHDRHGQMGRMGKTMRDEGDIVPEGWPRAYTPWGVAWRVALAVAVLYVLLTAILVIAYGR